MALSLLLLVTALCFLGSDVLPETTSVGVAVPTVKALLVLVKCAQVAVMLATALLGVGFGWGFTF